MSDDDAGPRIYGRTATEDGEVELTVEGNEHESAESIARVFDARLEKLVDEQEHIENDDATERGVE